MLNFLSSIFIRDTYCYTQLIINQVYTPISLLLYSHIPTAIITLIAGIFLLTRNRNLQTKIFFFLTLVFFLFTLGDLTEWFAFLGRGTVIFARSIIELLDPVLFILSSYFLFVLIEKRDVRLFYKIIWLLPLLPLVLRVFLGLNLTGYNWQICEVIESSFSTAYIYYIDLFYLISAIIFAIWSIMKVKGARKEISIISMGVCLFMVLFFVMEYVFTGYIFGGVFDYNYFLYALFGMPILIIFLAYLTVKYNLFKTRLIVAQVVVIGAFAIIFAQYFFIDNTVSIILNTVALFGMAYLGNILIKNVKGEISQKEKLAKLNIDLENIIKQRESLVHLVTHKVKGSFTRTKYIFAGILDGTYGPISSDIKKIAKQGLEFDNGGIQTVDLVLEASNLTSGGVKYDMHEIDLKDIAQKLIEEKRFPAGTKGLKMESFIKGDTDGAYNIVGDSGWIKEAFNNLIENSIRYTKEGKITVGLEKKDNVVLFSVKDTGIGINDEDKKQLFTEGGRGKDSTKINVDSTGYGLFSVKLIVEAHKGRVWGESEGEGKGSSFFIELPAKV